MQNDELLNLKGRRAIVTGGAVGIGYGIVARLAAAGAQVLVADISPDNIEIAKQKADPEWQLAFAQIDVAKEADITAMCAQAVKEFGGIDILVNNAGIYPMKSMLEFSADEFDKVMAVNLRSVFLASKCAAQQMIAQGKGGKIINVTSIDALHPSSVGLAHYDASKHGEWGLSKNMALELSAHNITVNAVAPGGIATPGVHADETPKEIIEAFTAKIPMKRFGESDEIGKVVLFLASDMASYMTGSQVVVDGGRLLG